MKKNKCFDFTLVMSASVNPNGMNGISDESMQNREQQYIDTLKFYSRQKCIHKILFVDNSNWDLSKIKRAVGYEEKISYLSFDGNSFPRAWGKGYGEFLLMDKAIDYLSCNSGNSIIIKVTGRFPILNISSLVNEFSKRKNLQLAVDVVDNWIYRALKLKWSSQSCRTIIYALTIDFYKKYLYGRYKEIHGSDGGFWDAESFMLSVSKDVRLLSGIYLRFKTEPWLSGFAGGKNHAWITANNYDGVLAITKRVIKQFCRWVLPFLWL